MIPLIQVKQLSKRYRIGQRVPNLWDVLRQNHGHPSTSHPYHWAVKDVSFDLQAGEALGIIGPNGAGKTTILKLLSQVAHPTQGKIQINGRLSALIELGAGFHPDLSGRENIYLNGTILGMRRSEVKARFDQIVEFANIGDYLDTPVKRYSSGMYARLGFAVAAHVDPQILLVDEVLAVGDLAFQTKCHARMDELRKNGTALILIAHNMSVIRRVCDRGLVMYGGRDVFQGTAAEAVVAYSDTIRQAARNSTNQPPSQGGLSQRIISFDAEIEKVTLLNEERTPSTVIRSGTKATVVAHVRFHKDVEHPIFGLFVRTEKGERLYVTTTQWQKIETPSFCAGDCCLVEYELNIPLVNGLYELGVDVAAPDLSHYYDRLERALSFNVVGLGPNRVDGIVDLGAKVHIKEPVSIVHP